MDKNNSSTVKLLQEGEIGIIEIDYPPVNALSQSVRLGIVNGIDTFANTASVKAIIIRCASRTFIAGADIKEFALPPTEPYLPDVVSSIEASEKPVIASLFGTSLGGGFEVALACHYRVALASAKVGLPEVNLGLIPGAGGTQRLPRIIGISQALQMITSGQHRSADSFGESELFDAIFESTADLNQKTLEFTQSLIQSNRLTLNRVGDRSIAGEAVDWQDTITQINKMARGKEAPLVAAKLLQQTISLSITEGMKLEREAFLKLRESEQSAALRYAFAAEKDVTKVDLNGEALAVNQVGIIGGGNMGSGIATAFLASGFSVQLIEQNEAGLSAGIQRIQDNFAANVKRGRMSQQQADDCLAALKGSTDFTTLKPCELIIEAVFEDLQVKKDLFSKLDAICHKDCIFATNTSYLDIDQIASVVKDPGRVIGMHFFSPANIMKLLEVVKAKKSSHTALVTAMAVGKRLGKVSVLVGVCFGFAGNRMYTRYGREIQQMLLEGATIAQIDNAMTNWGMAMGPLAVQDLSGIDIGHRARNAQPFPAYDPGYFRAAAVMVENGRLGRKTGKGFYAYTDNGKPEQDDNADALIRNKAADLGIEQRTFTDEEIVDRALLALISEGIALFREGIVQRLSDIDVIWLHGYGFPRHKGGPIFQARQLGQGKLATRLEAMRSQAGEKIWPQIDLICLS